MNTSALISAIVVALASYAVAAPVPQDGGAGNETVGFNFPRPIHTFSSIGRTRIIRPLLLRVFMSFFELTYSFKECVGGCGVNIVPA